MSFFVLFCFSCFLMEAARSRGTNKTMPALQGCSLCLPLFTQSHLDIVLKTREEIGSCSQTICKMVLPQESSEGFRNYPREKMLMFPHLSQASFLQHSRGLARDIFGSSLKLRGFRKCTWGDVACALLVLSLIFLSEARTYPESA